MTALALQLVKPDYRRDIDGLRAVAVLSVVAFHAFPTSVKGGFIGVDIFFVISGFLISTIILENLGRRRFSFTEFYVRRANRIFPALLLVLVTSYAAGWFLLLADEYQQLGKHIAAGAAFVYNFAIWKETSYFNNLAETKPMLHLWSLGIEEQFYILWPFVLWVAWKKQFNLLSLTIGFALLSFALNMVGIKRDPLATFYSPQTRFWELLCGGALAWFSLFKKASLSGIELKLDSWRANFSVSWAMPSEGKTLSNVLSIAGVLLLVFGFGCITKDVNFPGAWAVIPVLGAALIVLAGPEAWFNREVLSNKIAVWFGLISFPLYLWHWPLLTFARIVEGEVPNRNIRVSVIVISVILAWMTYRFIENPIRSGRGAEIKVTVLAALMGLMGIVGYITYSHEGLNFRAIAKRLSVITEAKKDWHYASTRLSDGKVTGLHEFEGRRRESVLFAGSSLMGQYFPRVQLVYSNSLPYYSTIFASRNHCTPIPLNDIISAPENINCKEYYDAVIDRARDKLVAKVVFAANWPDFYRDGKLTKAAEMFARDLLSLKGQGKRIIILTNPPINDKLSPDFIASIARKKIINGIRDYSMARAEIEPSIKQFLNFADLVGVEIINPFDYLCDNAFCPVIRDGVPLYIDHAHIRAKYAETNATFIDKLLNDE